MPKVGTFPKGLEHYKSTPLSNDQIRNRFCSCFENFGSIGKSCFTLWVRWIWVCFGILVQKCKSNELNIGPSMRDFWWHEEYKWGIIMIDSCVILQVRGVRQSYCKSKVFWRYVLRLKCWFEDWGASLSTLCFGELWTTLWLGHQGG